MYKQVGVHKLLTTDSLFYELCVTFTGRWDPDRLFMIFLAYMDESDTHGSEPTITMSAILGTASQWEKCRRRLGKIKKEFGFKVLHGTEFKARKGEFKGWSLKKCEELLLAFGKLVHENLTEIFTVTLDHQTYKEDFLEKRPGKMHATSQYGFAFEAVLFACSQRVLQASGNNRLSLVIEDGHKNAADTARIFETYKKEWLASGRDFLKTHTLASKEDDELLMIADITAFGMVQEQRSVRKGLVLPHGQRGKSDPPQNKIGWTHLEVTPGYFETAIKRFSDLRNREQEAWRRNRDERRAKLPE